MVVVDGRGVPLGDYLHAASPAEVRLAETTLAAIRVGLRWLGFRQVRTARVLRQAQPRWSGRRLGNRRANGEIATTGRVRGLGRRVRRELAHSNFSH
jgi:hypothetical protein